MDHERKIAELHANLKRTNTEVIDIALALLREDIQDSALNDLSAPGVIPDTYMLRAHQIGLALFDNQCFAIAERLYRRLAEEVLDYSKRTGEQRFVGVLHFNIAVACAAQGNIDRAVVELWKAAEESARIYEVPRDESVRELLKKYFSEPATHAALNIVQQINPSITHTDIESLRGLLGTPREYAFLAYIHLADTHEKANRLSPNEFSQLQLFSAMRSLSSLLEVELKTISGNMQSTLHPTLETLFKSKHWWNDFEDQRKAVGAVKDSNIPIDDQLSDAISMTPKDSESRFWKSLLVAYIARNYTTHQLEIQSAIVQLYAHETLGHILHVMITAQKHR
jgi:hypothetical protein